MMTGAFPKNIKNVVYIIKIFETGMFSKVTLVKSKKYYEISTIYINASKIIDNYRL